MEENKGFSDRYTPVYETCGLKGAVYEIRAAEDIYTPDGTLRAERVRWLIPLQRMTVGKHPVPFYLGKYEISEAQSPFGMVLNTKSQLVELVYAGQEVEVTETSASFIMNVRRY